MILVTVGTHFQPFDRLIRVAEALAAQGAEVVVQKGTSRIPTPSCQRSERLLEVGELESLMTQAELIITHGGPATLFQCWERGKKPVVMARDPALGEHIDGHQLQFVAALGERASVYSSESALLFDYAGGQIKGALEPEQRAPAGISAAFLREFEKTAQTLSGRSTPRERWGRLLRRLTLK